MGTTGALAGRGIHLGPVSLGCAQLGNLYGKIRDSDATGIVNTAWERGIRYFDTAPHYGLGLSEQRLGDALAGRPRDEFVISTKVGRMLDPNPHFSGERDSGGFDVPAHVVRRWDFSADGVRRSIESSLQRLKLDRIDLVLLHDPQEHFADPEQAMREAYPALARLRAEGVIGAIGVGTKSCSSLLRFVEETEIDAVMPAGRYTLVNQEALDELLPACEERSVDVLNAGAFNSGILASPRPSERSLFDYGAATESLIRRVNNIADVCDEFGTTVPRIALQFAASHPAIRTVVVGADSAAQVGANLDLIESVPAPRELWRQLAQRRLIPESAANGVLANNGGLDR
ncbi:MAG: D-threo-aldose 1-dehydrogenase [Microbacteriaceae bacterium]|nr:D-threo-aldose 1-dehydrogenase [Microbacteriaceae bacterium]